MILSLIIVFLAVFLDQITKFIVSGNMDLYERIPLIKGVFNITYTTNDGAGWSILSGKTSILVALSTIAILFILFVIIKYKPFRIDLISLSMILGGAAGNLIDRIRPPHEVIDFFDFALINFPVFNVADIFITIGGAIFIANALFNKKSIIYLFENKKDNNYENN